MSPKPHFPPNITQTPIDPLPFAHAFASLGSNFLRQPELDALALESLLLQVPPKATLFTEGESQPYLFLIESGRIELNMRAPGRPNVKILSLGPGNPLAWSALSPNQPMTCSAISHSASVLLAIPALHLHSLVDSNSSFGVAFYQRITAALTQRLTATRLQLLDLYHPHVS